MQRKRAIPPRKISWLHELHVLHSFPQEGVGSFLGDDRVRSRGSIPDMASELLDQLDRKKIRVTQYGDLLRVEPAFRLSDPDRDAIRQAKVVLMQEIATRRELLEIRLTRLEHRIRQKTSDVRLREAASNLINDCRTFFEEGQYAISLALATHLEKSIPAYLEYRRSRGVGGG